ncbi:hypothetical protein E3N88_03396 [Mikania micrantha]|uniref:25S rRNA (uridine-N(3))-methyltransferase BMT5-like domain-containing protein n=1 Tax=Mikania micrantha TaxID=192012 RepID=A0A5N6Q994_9ASTR|nr:hypothetical protein E3N88_03396 [Mikania micrantha]
MKATILHGVDVTVMKEHTEIGNIKYDVIIFNFSHVGYSGHRGDDHNDKVCLVMIDEEWFNIDHYHGYENKKGDGAREPNMSFIHGQTKKKAMTRSQNLLAKKRLRNGHITPKKTRSSSSEMGTSPSPVLWQASFNTTGRLLPLLWMSLVHKP